MTSLAEKGTPEQPTEEASATQLTSHGASAGQRQRVTLDLVLGELRKQHFAVLSTADDEGTPHSAGVNYGVSEAGGRIALYVMTRRHLRKTRNIARKSERVTRCSGDTPIPTVLATRDHSGAWSRRNPGLD